MLAIHPKSYAELHLHAEETYPEESCGILLGTFQDNGSLAVSAIRCINIRRDAPGTRYAIDPTDLVRVQQNSRERGLEIVGFYHSHPDHPAQYSSTDLADAYWIGCSYVITSVVKGQAAETRSFRLEGTWNDKKLVEEVVECTR